MHLSKIKKNLAVAIAVLAIVSPSVNIASAYENDNNVISLEQMEMENEIRENEIIDGLNMSLNDINNIYQEFLKQTPSTRSEDIAYDDTADFVEYAVSVGAIEDTEDSRLRLTVGQYRSHFMSAGNLLINTGFYYAGTLLKHSLQNKPSSTSYSTSSNMSRDLKATSEYKNQKTIIKNKINKEPSQISAYNTSGSFAISSKKDLYLALNKVSYSAKCTKTSGKWNIAMTVKDTYNFEKSNYTTSNGIPAGVVTIVNNYAVGAQQAGAIVPFSVQISAQDSL